MKNWTKLCKRSDNTIGLKFVKKWDLIKASQTRYATTGMSYKKTTICLKVTQVLKFGKFTAHAVKMTSLKLHQL